MYSPINNASNMTMENIPNFLNFVLLPTFDPSDNYEVTHSYAYNELQNDIFNYYLKSIESKNIDKSKSNSFSTNTHKTNFLKRHATEISLMFKELLDKTTLTTKFAYKLKDYYVSQVYVNNSEKSWKLHATLCVHKDDCAYGKIIDISLLYYVEKQYTIVLNIELFGVVPQEFISDIRGTFTPLQNQVEHHMHAPLNH